MYGIQLVSHSLVRSGFDIACLKLSASTPPSYFVVFVLLCIYPRFVSYTAGVTFPNKVMFGHCM